MSSNFLPALKRLLNRLLRRDAPEPQDPYARVPVPLRRGPGGRSSAAALEEPPQVKSIHAFGRWRSRDQ